VSVFEVGPGGPLRGRLSVPGDKSISHRVLLLAALADGTSTIRWLSDGLDVRCTLSIIRQLGADVDEGSDGALRIRGGRLHGPDDVLDLMDTGAEGIVAVIRDAGATFLSPIFEELAGVVCTGGTIRSHIGIVSREFQVPGVVAAVIDDEPADGTEVELDGSGVIRRIDG